MRQRIIATYRYNRKRFLMLLCLIAGFVMWSMAYCDKYSDAGGFGSTIFSWIDTIFGAASLDDLKSMLNVSFSSSGSLSAGKYTFGSSLTTVISNANKVFVNVGTDFVLVIFLVSMTELLAHADHISPSQIVYHFFMLVVGVALVKSAMDITFFICNCGSSIVNKITISSTSSGGYTDQVTALKDAIYSDLGYDTVEDSGAVKQILNTLTSTPRQLSYIIQLFPAWICALAANVCISFTVWSRLIQILLFAVISPLTVCMIGSGDRILGGPAMRGIKNIIALSLSGPLIYLSVYICNELQMQIISGVTDKLTASAYTASLPSLIIISIVKIGMVTKAASLAKQAIGL